MSFVLWIEGDAALAKQAAAAIGDRSASVVLDAARMRRLLAPDACDTPESSLVGRALVHLAEILSEQAIAVVIHGDGSGQPRDLARAVLPHFAEIREADGEAAVAQTVAALAAAAPVRTRADVAAWAIWLTGVPGSGKTTLAYAAADALAARGEPVAIVDWARVSRFVTPGGPRSPRETDVLLRTMLAALVLLTDAGVPVVVDATAPRREWREIARDRIARFAEVQLLCPPSMAADRERAVRWDLAPCVHGRPKSDVIETALDYELALAPDLTLHTSVLDVPTATTEIVRLAQRLAARRVPRVPLDPKESSMRVQDLMTRALITVGPDTSVTEARSLMAKQRIRHLLVTERERLLGIVTDRDIRLNIASPATSLSVWELNFLLARLTVGEVMTKAVLIVDPARDVRDAARIMLDHRIGALPVVDGERLVGILTETDLVRAFAEADVPAPAGR